MLLNDSGDEDKGKGEGGGKRVDKLVRWDSRKRCERCELRRVCEWNGVQWMTGEDEEKEVSFVMGLWQLKEKEEEQKEEC